MNSPHPLFSIIVLYWNNHQTIASCLDALCAQTYQDFEVLLVDNGSDEPIPADLVGKYSNLALNFYPLEKNIGFAGGNNFASSHAKGDYLVLLNADAFPNPDWLEKIHQGIIKYPNCILVSKLIMTDHPDRLDGEGDVYHISGLVWRKSHNLRISDADDQEREVFSACGAAAVYPINAFRSVNGFDSDYFSYLEDIDLGFRMQLIGYKCIYLPDAIVNHVGSGSTSRRSDFSVYHGQRNLIWTFIKNMPGIWVWVLAPIHLITNLLLIVLAIYRRQGKATLRGKWDALLGLPAIIRKRQEVQKTRSIPIHKLMHRLDWNPISPIVVLMQKW